MAKKKYDYRAVQAHKRNQQKIADKQAAAKEKEFINKYGLKILIGVAALIALIVVINLVTSYFWGPAGSLPQWFGTLRTAEEDWIITNTGTTSDPRYYKFGEYTAPEGYTLDPDYNGSTDKLNQFQYYNADDETAPVQSVYVSGVKGVAAQTQLNSVMGYYPDNSGAKQATIAGMDVHYTYIVSETTVTQTDADGNTIEVAEEDKTAASFLVAYIDTVQNSSILVMLNTSDGPKADVVTEDVLLAELEKVLPNLTVEK